MNQVIKESWKAIVGFVAVLVGQLIQNVVDSQGQVVLPQTSGEWVSLFGLSLAGALAVYVTPQLRNKDQVKKDIDKLDNDATEEVLTHGLDSLPAPATDRVIANVRPPATND